MSLVEAIADPARKEALMNGAVLALEAEVASLSGIKGKAISAGYAAVTKVKPLFVRYNIERMMPMVAPAIDQRLAEGRAAGDVDGYFRDNAGPIADDLLAVTDQRAATANNAAAVKIYNKLRSSAKDQVIAAMPRVSALAQAHG